MSFLNRAESVTTDAYKELPSQVRVGSYVFAIEVSEPEDSIAMGEFGHCNMLSQKIRLAPGMSKHNLCNTLFHECLHAVHWVYGLKDGDSEEHFTNLSTNGLCAFFQDNPHFTNWFLKNNAI